MIIVSPRAVNHVFSRTTARAYSVARPSLIEIFPKKKFINRQLFDLDSRLTYRKLMPAYQRLYDSLDSGDPEAVSKVVLPGYVNGSDLLLMKLALEKYRSYSGTINRHLLALENQLVEKSAEYGNNDAIALLAFETLTTLDESVLHADDKPYAALLIKDLYGLDHPLTVKLLGDLSLKHERYDEAVRYYHEFLALENDTVLSSEVYKQLGMLNFRVRKNLHDAKLFFLQSVKYGPLDKTLECHYFLGELFAATEPRLARFHLQLAASKSFRQAFRSLGFLELNYFNSYVSAREWFRLGVEVYDYDCLIGLFDTFHKFGKFEQAVKTLKSIRNVFTEKNNNVATLNSFVESRNKEIMQIMEYQKEAVELGKARSLATAPVQQGKKTSIY